MSNAFNFGIGISVDSGDASKAIGAVIADVQSLHNSMASFAGASLDEIFKDFDPGKSLAGVPKFAKEAELALEEVRKNVCGTVVCLEEVGEQAKKLPPVLEEVKTATGDWKDSLREVPGLMDDIGSQAQNIHAASDMLTGMASQLEYASVRTEAALGGSRKAAMDFGTAALETANRTKVAWEDVAQLQVALRGVSVDFDTTTAASRRQMDTMVLLSESFGMSQEEVASLAGTMKATGGNLEELAGIGVAFQTQFKVPGLLNQMPVAAKAAMDAQATFGTLVGKSSKDITVNIMKMTGTYAKSLGVTAAEAAQKAMATFSKFTAEIESYEDLFLGLADDFSPLQTAFLETGMGLEDMQDLMKEGQEDPAAYAESVKKIRDSMDPQMGERFFRQVLRNSDEATRLLLTQEEAAKSAQEATAGGAGAVPDDPSATFMKIAEAMRGTAIDAVKQKEALEGVAVEMAKLAASEGIAKGVQMINGVLQSTNTVLLSQWNQLRDNEAAMQTFTNVIAGTTAGLVGLSTAANAFGAIFQGAESLFLGVASGAGLLLKPIIWLIDKLKIFGPTASGAGAAGGGLGASFKGLAKIIGKLALPIGIAIAAFDNVVEAAKNIGAILSDPSATGMDKVKGVFKEVLGAVWGTFSDFFLGLPQMFIDGFMNVGKAVDTTGAESFGKVVGNVVGMGLTAIKDGFFLYLDYMKWMFTTAIPGVISASFDPEVWMGILSGLSAVGEQILGFFKGVGVGILEGLGMTTQKAEATMNVVAAAFGLIGAQITMFFADTFSKIGQLGSFVWNGITEGFYAVRDNLMIAGATIMDVMSGNFTGIQMAALSAFKSMAEGIKTVVDGILESARSVADALGMESMVANIDQAKSSVTGFSDQIDGMIAKEEAANRERAAASASVTGQVVADLALEKEARDRAFNETQAQYAADAAARQKVVDDKKMAYAAAAETLATVKDAPTTTSTATGAIATSILQSATTAAASPAASPTSASITGAVAPPPALPTQTIAQVASAAGGGSAALPGTGTPAERATQMIVKTLLEITVNATPGLNRALAESLQMMHVSQNGTGDQ